MMNNFMNGMFGKIGSGMCKLSMSGNIAVKTSNGYKSYMEQRLRAGGCCGGRYTYQFVPTSIGTVGEVICSCGEKFTFQDLQEKIYD